MQVLTVNISKTGTVTEKHSTKTLSITNPLHFSIKHVIIIIVVILSKETLVITKHNIKQNSTGHRRQNSPRDPAKTLEPH